jgi:AraC-like DNA-binding protein
MQNLKIHHAGFFSKKEHYIQTPKHLFLFFQISGLNMIKTHDFTSYNAKPFCYLFFPEDSFEFDFNDNRKNWVVQFSYDKIKHISNSEFCFAYEQENIILPRKISVTAVELPRWKDKFEAITKAFITPTPHERTLAQLYLLDIFKYYIECINNSGQQTPESELKRLIDMPENMRHSLSELSVKCEYSTDHLRVLFKKKYGISPQEYKIRRIMTYAMELICKSTLTVSDVSEKCGFEHLSHFSYLFKKTHGIPPSEALKKFRYR